MKKSNVWAIALPCALLAACGSDSTPQSEVQERQSGTDSGSWQNEALVASALGAPNAIRVNLTTNYATYYESGSAKAKWKIASARPGSGGTPRGLFKIHQKETCPAWNDGNGKSAAPCAANNPLGKKALWFNEARIYGMHGVDSSHLASVTSEGPRTRDQSSGCVRNHPNNIEWLFARASVGTPVVVGTWSADPSVQDCSGASSCDLSGNGGGGNNATPSLLPKSLPTWCAMNVTAGTGIANVRSTANTTSSIVSELRRDSKVKVEQAVTGESTRGSSVWYKVSYTLGGAKSGFLHSSLLDCTR